jgi:hypothetical protein
MTAQKDITAMSNFLPAASGLRIETIGCDTLGNTIKIANWERPLRTAKQLSQLISKALVIRESHNV